MKRITRKKADNRIESAFALSIAGMIFFTVIFEPIALYLSNKYGKYCSASKKPKAEFTYKLSVISIILVVAGFILGLVISANGR